MCGKICDYMIIVSIMNHIIFVDFFNFEMTKWKLTNKVHPSQIGYYKSGEWHAKLLYNFKLVAYLHDPVRKEMGWSDIVRSDEHRDHPKTIKVATRSARLSRHVTQECKANVQ